MKNFFLSFILKNMDVSGKYKYKVKTIKTRYNLSFDL